MKVITVQMGTEKTARQFPDDATFGDVIGNPNIRAELGYGDNVKALVLGVEQSLDTRAPAGCTVRVETKANEKNLGWNLSFSLFNIQVGRRN